MIKKITKTYWVAVESMTLFGLRRFVSCRRPSGWTCVLTFGWMNQFTPRWKTLFKNHSENQLAGVHQSVGNLLAGDPSPKVVEKFRLSIHLLSKFWKTKEKARACFPDPEIFACTVKHRSVFAGVLCFSRREKLHADVLSPGNFVLPTMGKNKRQHYF